MGSVAVVVGVVALGTVTGGVATVLQEKTGQHAAASVVHVASVEEYDAALGPLRKRSDVLERRFAQVQGKGYTGPDQVRQVLEDIVPEYAELVGEVQAIEVEGKALNKAHTALLDSLGSQQNGLELALRGLEEDDSVVMAKAGQALVAAERLLKRHRALLSDARR